ncbi:MAG: ATP-binding protein, partial [Pseudobdellovibrionaceae bacterium]|nr:ATP-binding protein [Pseudobdellovibrionaceae bacterium]
TSSRRLAEEAQKVKQSLDLALKIGGIGIWVLNVRTGEVYRDDQIFAIYGIKRESFPNDFQSWTQLVHPDDRKRVVSDLESAIKSGQDLDFMFKVIRPDGTLRHLRAIAQIVRDGAGRTTSVTGVNWDITDQVEREVRLQEAKDKAEQASRAKSDFLANMSHEIRTPLNGVFGMLSLLKDSDLSKIQLEMLQTIETCSEGLLTVLNDVLDLSRIESRRIQMEQVPFDIHQCSQDVIKLMLPQATHKKLPLHFDGDAVKSRVVLGDAARFKQVLMNLISNAIKFTEQGEVRLCMHGHELDPQHFHFVIEVKDTGIGISQDNQKKLFKAFSQADSTISRRFGGTGLGLTISASLVELMGGRMEMESHPGKGSIFRLQLPLSLAQAAPIHALHGKSESLHAMIDASQRILVVEDNKINQIVVTTLLNKMGFVDVDVAEDGLMALQQLELKHYDLIFMDMQMPGMDGLTATRRIREDMKKRPLMIIAMTANAFDEDRRKCLEAGMDDFLAKPFNRHDLERILLRLTERKAS